MATSAQNFSGLLGDIFGGGGGATGLEDYLTPAQTEQMNRQALLQAAIAATQASAPSTTPKSFMQILGAGLAGGQQGYAQAQEGAMKQLLTKQKLDEYKRQMAEEQAYRDMFTQMPVAGAAMTPSQALSVPGMALGPTNERAAMINQPMPAGTPAQGGLSSLTPAQINLLKSMPAKEGRAKLLELMQPPEIVGQAFKAEDGNFYYMTKQGPIQASIKPADLGAEEYGAPVAEVRGDKTVMVQYNKKGQSRIVEGVAPYEAQSQDIRGFEYITGKPLAGTGPAGVRAVGEYRQQVAPKTQNIVNVPDFTAGERGFKNEMQLSGAFKGEQIYKDFNDMKAAYGQVVSSLAQGTPIGDVAGATKVMKLLDPGSVVRESELGIAMAASGRMDRLQYYFNNLISGEKLTPTQREDFKQLSAELYAAAGQSYNQKRGEYKDFGGAYGFKNLDTALGEPAKIPSIVRKQPGGDAKRKPMADIFKRTP